mmetsp:Transcript_13737/g.43449  ORF Transcript_13737/g.43449 Transcript_13737/m.43449 type:complete len:233 (-) Transcript_13737:1070-1768(-)
MRAASRTPPTTRALFSTTSCTTSSSMEKGYTRRTLEGAPPGPRGGAPDASAPPPAPAAGPRGDPRRWVVPGTSRSRCAEGEPFHCIACIALHAETPASLRNCRFASSVATAVFAHVAPSSRGEDATRICPVPRSSSRTAMVILPPCPDSKESTASATSATIRHFWRATISMATSKVGGASLSRIDFCTPRLLASSSPRVTEVMPPTRSEREGFLRTFSSTWPWQVPTSCTPL